MAQDYGRDPVCKDMGPKKEAGAINDRSFNHPSPFWGVAS